MFNRKLGNECGNVEDDDDENYQTKSKCPRLKSEHAD